MLTSFSSKMGFQELLCKRIDRGDFEQFERYSKDLLAADPKYGEVFLYALSLANEVSESYFKNNIMLIGGFGVLGHMIAVEGPDIVKKWRGSHDLDIACQTQEALSYVLREFASEEHQSTSLPDKKKAKFYDPTIEELLQKASTCEGDIYYPSNSKYPTRIRVGNKELKPRDFKTADVISVYDIPLSVHNKFGLLGMKLGVVTSENLPRPKDITDIYNLLGICERQGLAAEVIYNKFNDEEKGKLMDVFEHGDKTNNRYILINPTAMLIDNLCELYLEESMQREH